MPRLTLKSIAKSPKVYKAWDEGDRDGQGYWAELKKGWICAASGAHSCHEYTLERLSEAVDGAEKCDCSECVDTE